MQFRCISDIVQQVVICFYLAILLEIPCITLIRKQPSLPPVSIHDASPYTSQALYACSRAAAGSPLGRNSCPMKPV